MPLSKKNIIRQIRAYRRNNRKILAAQRRYARKYQGKGLRRAGTRQRGGVVITGTALAIAGAKALAGWLAGKAADAAWQGIRSGAPNRQARRACRRLCRKKAPSRKHRRACRKACRNPAFQTALKKKYG